jgi:tight adherence protein C
MPSVLWIPVALASLGAMLGVWAIGTMAGQRRMHAQQVRLLAGEGGRERAAQRRRDARQARLRATLARMGSPFAGDGARPEGVAVQLLHAGYRGRRAVAIYYGLRVALALILAGGVAAMATSLDIPAQTLAGGAAFAALLGWMLPFMGLKRRIRHRQRVMTLSLPDALDLMVVCVEAGLGLNQALVRVSEELDQAHPVLSEELALVGLEMRAGIPREQALRNLSERTGLDEVRSLVTMLLQAHRFGTPLARALRVHSDSLRTRRRQHAEEAAAKLSVKMLIPLVLFVFPAIFVVVLGPAFLLLMESLNP